MTKIFALTAAAVGMTFALTGATAEAGHPRGYRGAAPLYRASGFGHDHRHHHHGYVRPVAIVPVRPVYAAPVYARPVYAQPVYPRTGFNLQIQTPGFGFGYSR